MEKDLINQFTELAHTLQTRHGLATHELLALIHQEDYIPATIFASKLNPLQAIVTYLKINKHHTLSQIAKEIHRSYRAVWGASTKQKLTPEETDFYLPLHIYDEKHSIMESTVQYLKEHDHLRFSEIAKIIGKDPRTVWTTYKRAQKKDAQTS